MSSIKISNLTANDLQRLDPVLRDQPFLPHRWLRPDLEAAIVKLWRNESRHMLDQEGGMIWVAEMGGEQAGVLVYAPSPWESDVLGCSMGQFRNPLIRQDLPDQNAILAALLDTALTYTDTLGIDGIVCKVHANDTIATLNLEDSGFRLFDTVLDYTYQYRKPLPESSPRLATDEPVILRGVRQEDLEALLLIARTAFGSYFGRFHSDPHIGAEKATRVYEEWVRSSLAGYADWFCVAEIAGRVAGYIVWKDPSEREKSSGVGLGHANISAVHPDFAGQGIYTKLLEEGMQRMTGSVAYLEGPVHVNNISSQRGLTRLNWRISDARHSFHRWCP